MKIAKDIVVYLSVEIISKSIPFAMLPYLTRVLSPNEYGIITTFTSIVAIFNVLIAFSSQSAISSIFYKDKSRLRLYLDGALKLWVYSIFILVLIAFFLLFFDVNTYFIILSSLVFSIFWFPVSLYTTLMRLESNISQYAKFVVCEVFLNVLLTLLLVDAYKAHGRVYSVILSMIFFGLLATYLLNRKYSSWNVCIHKSTVSKYRFFSLGNETRRLLKICLPVIPHLVTGWIRSGLDRYIVGAFFSMALLGVYGVASQLSLVIGVVSSSVTLAIGPYVQKRLSEGYSKHKLVITIYVISIGLLIFGFLFILLCNLLAPLLLGDNFLPSISILPFFVIGQSIQGISSLFVVFIYYSESTTLLFKLAFPLGLIFVLSQFFTSLYFDFDCFLVLIVLQSFVYFAIIAYISNKVFEMPWLDLKGMIKVCKS
jgi:O-antigen/teichoic acid export membrane protein